MLHRCTALAVVALAAFASANDNGKALTPPLGWRSWNLYGANVDQDLIQSIMDGMVERKRTVNGKPTSLCDLGYCDVGLDDNWQMCGSPDAAPGMNYHDKDGNPIVNTKLFPDFNKMTAHAHSLGLTSGWYGNNCICSDHESDQTKLDAQIRGDVAAFVKYDFDSWKLDGCGAEHDLVAFNKYVTEAGKNITVENCHWGSVKPFKPDRSLPAAEGCPWNFYRSSGDVRASYASVINNLNTVKGLYQSNLSYPGCWAYPDMLQVGCKHGPGGAHDPGLSDEETRSHFGSWAIVSSPLTLSHDVHNDTISDRIWPVISNTEVLAVNQAYVGDSGGVYDEAAEKVVLTDAHIDGGRLDQFGEASEPVQAAAHQYLAKQLGGGKVAVLLMNSGSSTETLEADFGKVPGLRCSSCAVRDIWAHKDLGTFTGKWSGAVASHDAAFLVISSANE